MTQHVLLIGNGPSGESHTLTTIREMAGDFDRIARCNHFYVGENFGRHVDDLFFAVDNESLFSGIYSSITSGKKSVQRFMTPLQSTRLGFLTYLDVEIINFWRFLLEDDYFSSIYIRGSNHKLPTTGMQALHYYLTQGVKIFSVVGIDFYTSQNRYAFSREVNSRRLGDFNVIGYEDKAHSKQDDFLYFLHLAKKYDFTVNVLSAPAPWDELRSLTRQFGCRGATFKFCRARLEAAE